MTGQSVKDKLENGKNLEGSGHCLNWDTTCHLLGGTKKNDKILSEDSHCPAWDLNQAPHKYKSEALLLQSNCPVGWYKVALLTLKITITITKVHDICITIINLLHFPKQKTRIFFPYSIIWKLGGGSPYNWT